MMKDIKQINRAILKGSIVGNIRTFGQRSVMTIAMNSGRKKDNTVESSYVQVVSYKPLTGFKTKDKVTILAHIQNRRFMRGEKPVYLKEVVIDSIEHTKRILSSYVDLKDEATGGYPADENTVIFIGECYNVFQSKIPVILTVKIADGEYTRLCDISCFNEQAKEALKLKPGDMVALAGAFRSARTSKEGRVVSLQNVVCLDIERLTSKEDEDEEDPEEILPVEENM